MITVGEPIEADVLRLRSEFLEMPGLCLTVSQTARLLSIPEEHALELLESQVAQGFLICAAGGSSYRRPSQSR